MPNDYTLEPLAATYAEIYRQIAITLPEKRNFDDLIAQVEGLLREPPRVDYHILAKIPALRLFAIQVAPGQDVVGILERLKSHSDIVENAEQNRPLRSSLVVNDPLYWDQWALGRIGAEPAWTHALSTLDPTAPGVIVAVIDSGIHTGHPDLTGHLWDDGAGHHGFNLLTLSSDVSDAYGHGTQLAGTIGAISNNATGIAAAEWPIRLMAVKFLDVLHPPNALSGAVAIWWAVLNRAQVITAAWGVGIPFAAPRTAISF